ncbi:MAG: polyribonucleotide nucleotidyltransferase [Pseudomonadota bacterium]|uniref:polyribonucleotide nucleotidyltransferase n=1 Tax=marine metagenome TaxID=408172 RepID=A0A381NZQ8_9ZZZZ|nr:polyribonucleotide nucleotidyltransferase [Pseudomonadota bacterium]MEC9284971.1 polyribonucleotide nucleotidyltransferase [Pseudomonadota bacterium]HCP49717.1 polyribonucleotide nucleotidyltransferase [Gammaproteobacteria bacterium]
MNKTIKEFEYGGHKVSLEAGNVAKQATGAVVASMGDTVVLCTVVAMPNASPGQDFFPLTVNYQERTYAAGKIPGSFFRREGRPSEKETLTCRLIDRPIRPLFPKGFMNEVQVIPTVMSVDKDMDPDIISMIGTSAALAISGVPFAGPIGAARVGFEQGQYVLNPGYEALAKSSLNMVVAGTESAVLMVESEADELSEDQMLGAVLFGHQEMQVAIKAISELASEVGNATWEFDTPTENESLVESVLETLGDELGEAYRVTDKKARLHQVHELREQAIAKLEGDNDSKDVANAFSALEKKIVRERVLSGEPRIDGRDLKTVRPISVEVGTLPKTHGSALFQRGETQAIVVTTLGPLRDAALIDALAGNFKDHFMLHYNFPPYCVGEAGFMGGPKRREIGHGRLARRGIAAVLPKHEDFPYTLRVVSEITESNGSSSMASVCGTSLALMDAGVPISNAVAGVAMGLVKEGNRYAVLTDILGDEDHLGDMDFKVAGTMQGVTALQMDIKIQGVTENIMEDALNQAHDARVHILGEMNKVISEPRADVSENAPSMVVLKVHPDKIRDVIGKGGATIRSITEETGADIDIEDDGSVRIYADSADSKNAAVAMIEEITAEAEIGKIYNGRVERIVDFGAFINILPGKDGLLHISQIAEERVEKVSDYLEEGQNIDVVVLDVDQRGRIKLSMREVSNFA